MRACPIALTLLNDYQSRILIVRVNRLSIDSVAIERASLCQLNFSGDAESSSSNVREEPRLES